jgi:hypothetical protein
MSQGVPDLTIQHEPKRRRSDTSGGMDGCRIWRSATSQRGAVRHERVDGVPDLAIRHEQQMRLTGTSG